MEFYFTSIPFYFSLSYYVKVNPIILFIIIKLYITKNMDFQKHI